ncbi:hypothetical protein L228DRAFT_102541 [Xylona heveae TC161]|uniref:Uncharacterized protein n=1 Tax=Xylona heveae (strain CBS 132557 / TC161) TaxID=1328760 RepID=A0A165IC94_XYLHT|nr:hypothetical protein L228DRAFT_102541 [Xylona heveae TC161]KZF24698.1 hypothetical protein L228DRAFT_102541 [Xylona heveae TC161]
MFCLHRRACLGMICQGLINFHVMFMHVSVLFFTAYQTSSMSICNRCEACTICFISGFYWHIFCAAARHFGHVI